MGSGDWFKTNIGGKKVKESSTSEKLAGKFREHNQNNNTKCKAARRTMSLLTDLVKMSQRLGYRLLSGPIWLQAEIRDSRLYMVIEGRLKQKRLENQMKLEAKLHDLEVEWNYGSETMEEIVARIRPREEAAVKRERALTYAFSHQWRPNASQNQGFAASELGKANWGWSWKERWIAAHPWESRVPSQSVTPKKGQSRPKSKAKKTVSPLGTQKSLPLELGVPNQKAPRKPGRLSFPRARKVSEQDLNPRTQELKVKKQDSSFLSKTESKL